jgi:hypothetical protein
VPVPRGQGARSGGPSKHLANWFGLSCPCWRPPDLQADCHPPSWFCSNSCQQELSKKKIHIKLFNKICSSSENICWIVTIKKREWVCEAELESPNIYKPARALSYQRRINCYSDICPPPPSPPLQDYFAPLLKHCPPVHSSSRMLYTYQFFVVKLVLPLCTAPLLVSTYFVVASVDTGAKKNS